MKRHHHHLPHYVTLGISETSSKDDVKRAWRLLSKKFHPDRHRDDESKARASEKFIAIAAAYTEIMKQYEEPFGTLSRPARVPDVCVEVDVTLEDVYCGNRVGFRLPLRRRCPDCGAKATILCEQCEGEGFHLDLKLEAGSTVVRKQCSACGGEGRRVCWDDNHRTLCKRCKGHGIVRNKVEIRFPVPQGARSHERIRLEGEGEGCLWTEDRGDLVVFLKVLEHASLRRVGQDLVSAVTIDLAQALTGGISCVRHLDDRLIEIPRVETGTAIRPGYTIRIKGEGMPGGDLYLIYQVSWPSRIDSARSSEIVQAVLRWQEAHKEDRVSSSSPPPRKRQKTVFEPCKIKGQ